MQNKYRKEYLSRINRAMDYIENNLSEELNLEKIAGAAHFSKFHFHRIFKAFTDETPSQYITRLRLEKAATQLINFTDLSITRIALDCGFSSSAVFARSFKDYYGVSASQWRDETIVKSNNEEYDRKNCKIDSRIGKEFKYIPPYIWVEIKNNGGVTMTNNQKVEIEVKKTTDRRVAYVRHIGDYKGNSELFEGLFGKLCRWAGPRGLLNKEPEFICVYHDNPEITNEDQLKVSVCLTVGDDVEISGDVNEMKIPAGLYAVGKFRIDVSEYQEAWNTMFMDWLPESGYQPAEGLCYELSLNDPGTDPEGKHEVAIHIPVEVMK